MRWPNAHVPERRAVIVAMWRRSQRHDERQHVTNDGQQPVAQQSTSQTNGQQQNRVCAFACFVPRDWRWLCNTLFAVKEYLIQLFRIYYYIAEIIIGVMNMDRTGLNRSDRLVRLAKSIISNGWMMITLTLSVYRDVEMLMPYLGQCQLVEAISSFEHILANK